MAGMDIQAVSDVISQIGFPIVAFLLMVWINVNDRKEHTIETQTLTSAVKDLTVVIENLKTYLTEKTGENM